MISSNYATDRVFLVQNYDGIHIPFEQGSFDFVFSSSVLEHVQNFPALRQDICRVLKSDGIAFHVVPSVVWRFWTIVSGYWEGMRELGLLAQELFRTALSGQKANHEELRNKWNWINEVYFLPKKHGELGNAYTEIYTFSRFYWAPMFKNQGFRIQEIIPAGLFYTGNMFLDKRLSIKARQFLTKIIGSACSIYLLIPNNFNNPNL